jgi:hypothetical protein
MENATNPEMTVTYDLLPLPIKLDIGTTPTYYRSA